MYEIVAGHREVIIGEGHGAQIRIQARKDLIGYVITDGNMVRNHQSGKVNDDDC